MKKIIVFISLIVLSSASCRKIEVDGPPSKPGNTGESLVLEGKISSDRVLKSGNSYILRGFVYVVNGATLTIEPGTVIKGEKGTNTRGTLVITRGCKIIADGTKEEPIIFTSDQTNPERGDWGGLVILGNATTNASFNGLAGEGSVEGGVNNAEGLGLYGGKNDNDNSGILRYVRIEYAGYAYLPDNELNALTLAGVGRSTVIDYVQIYKANDDGIECFGGSVDLRHLIILSTLDDDLDTDNGWKGNVQWAIIMRDSSVADISKSEAFESDNDANGSELMPQTAGVYSNITVIGPRADTTNRGNSLYLAAAQIRRNSSISIFNSVFLGWGTGILIDASKGTPTDRNITGGKLVLQHNIIAGSSKPVDYAASATNATGWNRDSATAWFNSAENGNTTLAENKAVLLKDPFNYSKPDFTPLTNSPLLTGASFMHPKLLDFIKVNYRGAVSAEGSPDSDWWKGWSKLSL